MIHLSRSRRPRIIKVYRSDSMMLLHMYTNMAVERTRLKYENRALCARIKELEDGPE